MVDLPANPFKTALQKGRLQRGIWFTLRDSLAAEMLAGCGYDWMLIDTEHSPMAAPDVLSMLQAVAPYPVSPIVRPGSLDVAEIKKLLDLGAQSILVPMVNDADMACEAVAAVRYPPEGLRGVSGMSRANRFGKVPGYHPRASEAICLLVQVESVEALGNIEEIAAVEGVDGIFVGPADLAASLGHPGESSHPEVVDAGLDAVRRIAAAGVPPGILTMDPQVYDDAIAAGALFVSRDLDLIAMRKGLSPLPERD